MKKHRVLKIIAANLVSVAALVALLMMGLVVFAKTNINYKADELLFEKSQRWTPTTFYAYSSPDGVCHGENYTPIEIEKTGEVRHSFYNIEDISYLLTDGFVAVEDHRFFEHRGVDFKRTVSAALNYITRRKRLFGASTITQQVVKNISGDNGLSLKRKLSEILRAMHVERMYDKEEILEVYLNVIPMSENIYGVGMASEVYFGKPPSELSAHEAATLIGITNAPTAYNPYSKPEACLAKRNRVLKTMLEHGIIDRSEYEKSVTEPLTLIPKSDFKDKYDSWFVETAISEISRDLSAKYGFSESAARFMLLGGGYSVYTSMDIEIQAKLEEYFENTENLPKEVKDGLNYSMVVTDIRTGKVKGIIGRAGQKLGNRLLNHATVPHIPASALKPLSVYAPLIDNGTINYASVIDDTPVTFVGSENRPYPRNSPDVFHGLTTVKDAVRLSKNTVPYKLISAYGAKRALGELNAKFDFDTLVLDDNGKSDGNIAPMALGQLTRGVSLLKLTEAFASFGADGVLREAKTYIRVVDIDGNTVLDGKSEGRRVFKESTARIMNQILKSVTESGTARQITLDSRIEVAGKTGTSSGNSDKLFIGYTPYLAAGIWCGYDRSDTGVYGLSKSHIEIWDEVMTMVHEPILASEPRPKTFSTEGLLYRPYCMDSGKIYSDACRLDVRGDRREWGYFTADNLPKELCDCHILCDYDCVSKGVADDSCPECNIAKVALIRVKNRNFPKEITVTDAEYEYRGEVGAEYPTDKYKPYFYYALPPDTYTGIKPGASPFNRAGKRYE